MLGCADDERAPWFQLVVGTDEGGRGGQGQGGGCSEAGLGHHTSHSESLEVTDRMEVPVSARSVRLDTLVVGLAAVEGDSAGPCVGQPGSASERMPLGPMAWCWSLRRQRGSPARGKRLLPPSPQRLGAPIAASPGIPRGPDETRSPRRPSGWEGAEAAAGPRLALLPPQLLGLAPPPQSPKHTRGALRIPSGHGTQGGNRGEKARGEDARPSLLQPPWSLTPSGALPHPAKSGLPGLDPSPDSTGLQNLGCQQQLPRPRPCSCGAQTGRWPGGLSPDPAPSLCPFSVVSQPASPSPQLKPKPASIGTNNWGALQLTEQRDPDTDRRAGVRVSTRTQTHNTQHTQTQAHRASELRTGRAAGEGRRAALPARPKRLCARRAGGPAAGAERHSPAAAPSLGEGWRGWQGGAGQSARSRALQAEPGGPGSGSWHAWAPAGTTPGPPPAPGPPGPTDLFLAAAARSRCRRFLNQLPTCVGVSPVAWASSRFLLGFG